MTMRRRGSLKRRFEFVLGGATGVLLFILAGTLILVRYRDQKKLLENNALMFAQTTNEEICQQYRIYYRSGSYKFREIVRRTMAWNPDIHRLLIISVAGEVLYDTAESPDYNLEPEHPARTLEDRSLLDATAELTPRIFHGRDPALGSLLMIVSPYIEEWGRHPYSVLYVFTYDSLDRTLREMIVPTLGLLVLSLAVMGLIAWGLAGRVVHPIEVLNQGVREFEQGRRAPLKLTTRDEIEDLAESFNRMAARLEEHVRRLERANEELKTLDRLKTDLLANVSHELRTPLSAIRGYVEFMNDGNLGAVTEQQARGLAICLRNIDRLNRTINMLLDFSRMELGRVVINVAPFRLDQLIRQIAASLEAELRKKNQRLTLSIAEGLPAVVADRERLTQVIENLMVNAIKFTPAGGELWVNASPSADRRKVDVEVADSGIGIPPSERERIFDKFYQVEASASRRFGGVGLGLAIVKSILDAHQVAIEARERPGGGTAFRFSLVASTTRPSSAEISVAEAAAEHPVRILAIDDDADFLSFLGDSLRAEGREFVAARTADEGLHLARTASPSIILLDVHLPDRDGFEVLEALKADPATRDIPTVMVTVVNEKTEGFRLGADDYLVKPIEANVVLEAVERALGRRHPEDRIPVILVVDDEPDVTAYLKTLLTRRGYEVVTAVSGADALEAAYRYRPALILLDIMMPEMSGWEVLRRLRDSPLAEVPVIVLSARDEPGDAEEGYRLGARRYLTKSAGMDRLLAEIRTVIGPPPRTSEVSP
jgi:signal transduction histidine kinase/DNA-binding response OmpR family regulator